MDKTKDINVLDIIIRFVKAIQDTPKDNKAEVYHFMRDEYDNQLWGAKYLLGQILRQYYIPPNRIFVSVEAEKLWEEIAGNEVSIRDYDYRKSVISKVSRCDIKGFNGASKKPDPNFRLEVGKPFVWNSVFHDEHIIPIKTIISRLEQLKGEDLNYEKVKDILNDIAICKMLKEENHILDKEYRTKRKETVKQTIEDIYINECKIQIVGWEDKKNKL